MASPATPIKYKTWILKVSIHCEGCKRKVKKILQSLPGVYDIDIETKQQRVSVTGDVTPEMLIHKLLKSGKHAELWPEKADKAPGKLNPCENISKITEKNEESVVAGEEGGPPATKSEIPVQDESKVTAKGNGTGGGKVDEAAGKNGVAEKKPDTGSAGNQDSQPVGEKKDKDIEKTGGAGGEGKKKKKKKKTPNVGKNGETSSSASPPVNGGSPENNDGGGVRKTATVPADRSPLFPHGYSYPPPENYSPAPAPVYGVSYNTAHPPVNSYTASYYPAAPPYSYSYMYSGSEVETAAPLQPQPLDYDSYQGQPLDSFEMFSDENPNGCSVM